MLLLHLRGCLKSSGQEEKLQAVSAWFQVLVVKKKKKKRQALLFL